MNQQTVQFISTGRKSKQAGNGANIEKMEVRKMNEVETDRAETTSGQQPPDEAWSLDYASLDQSCFADQSNDNPINTAPPISNGTIVKYARLDSSIRLIAICAVLHVKVNYFQKSTL